MQRARESSLREMMSRSMGCKGIAFQAGGEHRLQSGFEILLPDQEAFVQCSENAGALGKEHSSGAEDLPEQGSFGTGKIYQIDRTSGGEGDTIRKILERIVIERLAGIDRDIDVAVRAGASGCHGAEDDREIEIRVRNQKGESLASIMGVLHGGRRQGAVGLASARSAHLSPADELREMDGKNDQCETRVPLMQGIPVNTTFVSRTARSMVRGVQ
jgi:hypothetical protein